MERAGGGLSIVGAAAAERAGGREALEPLELRAQVGAGSAAGGERSVPAGTAGGAGVSLRVQRLPSRDGSRALP